MRESTSTSTTANGGWQQNNNGFVVDQGEEEEDEEHNHDGDDDEEEETKQEAEEVRYSNEYVSRRRRCQSVSADFTAPNVNDGTARYSLAGRKVKRFEQRNTVLAVLTLMMLP